MSEIASAVAFAQDVVALARTHGLLGAKRGRKPAAVAAAAPRKARKARATAPANGHTDEFEALTQ